jgi:ubiquinone biosynthesis protein UbiJ
MMNSDWRNFDSELNMATSKTVQQLNRELAQKLADEGKNNPQAPYAGKFVGIANGQVVVVADNLDELDRRLRQVEPDPTKTFGVEVGRDYDAIQYIWALE